MKKIMLAAAFAFVAFASQAAALNWTIQNIKTDDGATAGTGNAIMLFVSSYTGAVELNTASEASIVAMLKDGNVAGATALGSVTKTVGANGLVAGATGLSGFVKDETISAFAIVFNAANAEDATKFAVLHTAADSYKWSNNTAPVSLVFGDQTAATAAGNWQAIPEPTSGLLMLVGLAGLALRRRRA